MSDLEEIIYYVKSLKKGFDKDLFQCKIEELSYVVDSIGLEYGRFHTLFKIWLNISIPITTWVSLGVCLVPQDIVEEHTLDYAFRWLLANFEDETNFSRIAFLLDWLTGAMDTGSVDMKALDYGYEIFYSMLSSEVLAAHSVKLVYTMTKPSDVTRRRVLELLEYAKNREAKKSYYRQIQVLLGLFKSFRPECVPENIPASPVHTSFKKIKTAMLERFRKNQERRHVSSNVNRHLQWSKPLDFIQNNKKAEPLVPHMEFTNIGSKQYNEKEEQKNYLDFSDPVSLLQHTIHQSMSRPARQRALLCNEMGITLLAVASDVDQAFISHDLDHLLSSCFLARSPHSFNEKQDLAFRLVVLQRTLLQGIPVVTRFLARFLPLWNERDYFAEMLGLAEWVSVESPNHLTHILNALTRAYHRAEPMRRCAILKCITTMYANLVYASTRDRQHFMSSRLSQLDYSLVLPYVAGVISDLCNKALQASPDDMRAVYSCLSASEAMCTAEARRGAALGALPRRLVLALPLLSTAAAPIDKMAGLLLMYKKVISRMKSKNARSKVPQEQCQTLISYTTDMVNFLYHEKVFTDRSSGIIFNNLRPQLVKKLCEFVPEADGMFSMRNNLAFKPYTRCVGPADVSNELYLKSVVKDNFPDLYLFLMKAVPDLH